MEICKELLQYVPFSSVISPEFWESFSNLKLNKLQLNTHPIEISGIYSRRIVEGVSPLIHLQCDLVRTVKPQPSECVATGTLINTNTIEEFKEWDKAKLLKIGATTIWDAIVSGKAETNPSLLSNFLMVVFADLKKYHYYYWCAFPTFLHPQTVEVASGIETLKQRISSEELLEEIHRSLKKAEFSLSFFTLVLEDAGGVEILPLSSYYEFLKRKKENDQVWLGFSDPSNSPRHPGWVLRNLLAVAAVKWSDIRTHTIFALREKVSSEECSAKESLVFEVSLSDEVLSVFAMPSPLGWERNERDKMGPRFCNMMKTMDPTRVAESAVDLNLRLMKWRLDPILDLDVIKRCKCLLIGAGTLGCNVARCLLGWGVQKITFVDCGKVSYSNPVRQSLYAFEDCKGDRMKAEAAARALQKIYPRVDAEGVCISVPMPGHTVGASQTQQVSEDVKTLEKLFDEHDAVFLLTDSRESRWLPSLLGAVKQKIVLTAALGFENYLVMRHGSHSLNPETPEDLGCYFCTDVVAPGDSMKDRTLDQQCTVTRPGVAFMAAGHIVEMLVDILQYPVRSKAEKQEVVVAHSIRYYLERLELIVTSSPTFNNCSACGTFVISEYLKHGFDFLIEAFNSRLYLERASGLEELLSKCEDVDLEPLEDDLEDSD